MYQSSHCVLSRQPRSIAVSHNAELRLNDILWRKKKLSFDNNVWQYIKTLLLIEIIGMYIYDKHMKYLLVRLRKACTWMEPNRGLGAPADPNKIQLPTWRVVLKPVGFKSYTHTNIVVWQCFLLYRIKFIHARLPIMLYYTLVHTVWASPSGVLSGSIVVLWFRGPDTMQYCHPLLPLHCPAPSFLFFLSFSRCFLLFLLKCKPLYESVWSTLVAYNPPPPLPPKMTHKIWMNLKSRGGGGWIL